MAESSGFECHANEGCEDHRAGRSTFCVEWEDREGQLVRLWLTEGERAALIDALERGPEHGGTDGDE